jgi:hypothetical protein
MMLSSGLNEHANYNSEEPRNLWHLLLTLQITPKTAFVDSNIAKGRLQEGVWA